jgi:hypothetical protein
MVMFAPQEEVVEGPRDVVQSLEAARRVWRAWEGCEPLVVLDSNAPEVHSYLAGKAVQT